MPVSTREELLSVLDDMELICHEVLENMIAPKPRRLGPKDHDDLIQLLIQKDKDFKEILKLAKEQGELDSKIKNMEEEVKIRDDQIMEMQRRFKEAETLLSTSIFQAKQKLKHIEKSVQTPVSSSDLIKYAHKISASNAVCAPLNWQQGDIRRPYPTDIEMRSGFLARPETATAAPPPPPPIQMAGGPSSMGNAHGNRTPIMSGGGTPHGAGSGSDFHHINSPFSAHSSPTKMHMQNQGPPSVGGQSGGQFMWQGGDMMMGNKDGSNVHIPIAADGANQTNNDVEIMSTDSSSSSSTDSN